jgi:pilus assembly protein Flp/PilA
MLRAWQFCKRLWRSEEGPTAVEYAFLLALIVTVCIAAIQTVGSNTNPHYQRVGQSLAS